MKAFDLPGLNVVSALDDEGNVWVTSRSLENVLDLREDSVRKKWQAKSLKPFKDEALASGKSLATKTTRYFDESGRENKTAFYSLDAAVVIAAYEALNGNTKAAHMMALGLGDSIRSLTYEKSGIKLSTEDRERWQAARQKHRREFREKLTDWLKVDNPNREDYGKQVNIFKACVGVPLESVDDYTHEQLMELNTKYEVYSTLRKVGLTHEQALRSL
jgi:hypothetical protein